MASLSRSLSPSLSPHRSSSLPGIQELNEVLELLKKCGFSETRWFDLGLALGLSKDTLETIEANYPRDVHRCLIECLSKWLKRADDVDSKGGATWDSLSTGLRSINEIAVADMLNQEILQRSQVLAVSIFDKHHSVLSESLSDPINVARLLYADAVISQQLLSNVEADDLSLAGQRQVLLNAIREAVKTNHVHLQIFAIVLGKFSHNAKFGDEILKDYGIKFPSNEDIEIVQVKEGNETNGTASPSTKRRIVEIPVPRSKTRKFSSMRASYATMSCNVRNAIEAASVDLKKLKEFIVSYDSSLEGKINDCDTLSSVLRVIDKECSLVDITLFCAVVEHFKVAEAEQYIEEYRTKSKDFIHSVSIALCLKEKLKTIKDCQPSLQSEKVIYTFDWRPEEKKLEDIKDILSESSGKLVRIEYIDSSNSITVTCTFPYSLTGVLIARVMENMQFLKDNGLMRLTIGYWTIWEKEKASQREIELPQEQDVLLTIKSDQDEHVKLLGLNHQLMDTLAYLFLHLKLCTEKLSELKQEIEPASVAVLEEKIKAVTAQIEEEKMKKEHEAKSREQEPLLFHLTKKKQVTTVDADQAIALTSVEEKDLAISEDKKKYEEILKLKKGMTHEIEALRSSLKTKEAEKDEEIYQLKEKLKDMVQESQDKLNQRDQALALEGSTFYNAVLCYCHGGGDYQWTVTLFVGKSEEAIRKYIYSNVGGAQRYNSVATFHFIQPEGVLLLHPLTDDVPVGWTVCLHQSPMKILQSAVDKSPAFPNVSMTVYAKLGIALDPLSCPIKLTGIDPEITIFINRGPPPLPPQNIDNTTSTSSTTAASQTSRETEESTFKSHVAYKVMTECTGMIKKLRLNPLVDKLVENRIISETEKDEVTVQSSNLTTDQRMDKLLGFVKDSIKQDGEDFGLFIDIIKQEGTIRADRLAQKLLDTYNRLS